MSDDDGDWREWRNHVLKELERVHQENAGMRLELARMSQELAMLKTKASIWGGLAGTASVVVLIAIEWLKKR